jgi:RNase P protein component
MLPKKKRVTKELFQTIMKKGDTLSSGLFLFRYIPSPTPQYAFVAPKNIAKKAHDRNALRRRGYAGLRPCQPTHGAGIFFFKKQSQKAAFGEIKADIENIMRKTKLYHA